MFVLAGQEWTPWRCLPRFECWMFLGNDRRLDAFASWASPFWKTMRQRKIHRADDYMSIGPFFPSIMKKEPLFVLKCKLFNAWSHSKKKKKFTSSDYDISCHITDILSVTGFFFLAAYKLLWSTHLDDDLLSFPVTAAGAQQVLWYGYDYVFYWNWNAGVQIAPNHTLHAPPPPHTHPTAEHQLTGQMEREHTKDTERRRSKQSKYIVCSVWASEGSRSIQIILAKNWNNTTSGHKGVSQCHDLKWPFGYVRGGSEN